MKASATEPADVRRGGTRRRRIGALLLIAGAIGATTVGLIVFGAETPGSPEDAVDEPSVPTRPRDDLAVDVQAIPSDEVDLLESQIEAVLEPTPSSADEPSGSFRFGCQFSHLSYDDPIVYPDDPGRSHLHMFFGNEDADAASDYASLRTTGETTCQGGKLNRSAYWMPAVLDGEGMVVVPSWIVVYYKGPGTTSTGDLVDVVSLPPGLRMIAGRLADDVDSPSAHRWRCDGDGPSDLTSIPTCEPGQTVVVSIPFPHCWDGINLDAPDHRSHVAYIEYDEDTGIPACPSTHPVPIPEFTLNVGFDHDQDSDTWRLSSDGLHGAPAGQDADTMVTHEPGSSFHSDWFGGWDPTVQDTWTDSCINGLLNCSGGDLGDGTRLSPLEDPVGTPARISPPDR